MPYVVYTTLRLNLVYVFLCPESPANPWLLAALQFIQASRADSTQHAYELNWKQWQRWCTSVHHSPWTDNVWMLLGFGAYCAKTRENCADTIRQKFFAVQAYWQDFNVRDDSVFADRRVNQFLRGVLRSQGGRSQDLRLGITAQGLARFLPKLSSSHLGDVMIRAWMTVAYAGFLRESEYSTLRWEDVQFCCRKDYVFARLWLKTEKSLLTRKKRYLDIVPLRDFDPAEELWRLLTLEAGSLLQLEWQHTHLSHFVFHRPGGAPINYTWINKHLKAYATVVGVNPTRVKGHSFRIGATTDMARNGATSEVIKPAGRWSSNAFESYIRLNDESVHQNASRFLW